VPAFRPGTKDYALAWLGAGVKLRPGRMGILEPAPAQWAEPAAVGAVLVPGVAFDRSGGRLGRGGGYYDRLLRGLRAVKVGVAFEAQLVGVVPAGPTDQRVDWVVTEQGVYPAASASAGLGRDQRRGAVKRGRTRPARRRRRRPARGEP